jgi:hypothetical protein
MAIEPVLMRSGVDSTPYVGRAVFNKHVHDMRVDYSDEEIANAFMRFAEKVRSGTINVSGRSAWFTFYSWRSKLLRRESEAALVAEAAESLLYVEPDEDDTVLWIDPDDVD